jgi:hypothetical protein
MWLSRLSRPPSSLDALARVQLTGHLVRNRKRIGVLRQAYFSSIRLANWKCWPDGFLYQRRGEVIVEGAPVSLDLEATVTEAGDYRFFAGWRSDPFFFDPLGAVNNLHFTGKDFFAEKNVCSIVLEVPNSALGPKEVGLWLRSLAGAGGGWVQADRAARPSQGVFLPGEESDAYLAGEPRTMRVSSPSSRTRWSTPAGTPRRKRGESQRPCCRTLCAMTTRAPRHILTTDGHLLTALSTTSSLSSQTGK